MTRFHGSIVFCVASVLVIAPALGEQHHAGESEDRRASEQLEIVTVPETPLLEKTRSGHALSFDFRVTNSADDPILLRELVLTVRNPENRVLQHRTLYDSGLAPPMAMVTGREIASGSTGTIFNPFEFLPADFLVGRLDYELVFTRRGEELRRRVSVTPQVYQPGTELYFPLDGRVLVWAGHDLFTHHRRLDLDHPLARQIGLETNTSRYAFDFVMVDEEGRMHTGDGRSSTDHLIFGQPVRAPAAGVVVAATGEMPEGQLDTEQILRDPISLLGNHVIIDHGNGEFSQLGHLEQGSVVVQAGDRVTQGQVIGRVGNTGSSMFPHLHYELTRKPGLHGEGLPAYFIDADRVLGSVQVPAGSERLESGDIVTRRRSPIDSRSGPWPPP